MLEMGSTEKEAEKGEESASSQPVCLPWVRAVEKEFFFHLSFSLCSSFLAKRGQRLSFFQKQSIVCF